MKIIPVLKIKKAMDVCMGDIVVFSGEEGLLKCAVTARAFDSYQRDIINFRYLRLNYKYPNPFVESDPRFFVAEPDNLLFVQVGYTVSKRSAP